MHIENNNSSSNSLLLRVFLLNIHAHIPSSGGVWQMIDRICVKVQDHLNSLRNSETDIVLEDVKSAENFIRDARNSKTVRRASALGSWFFFTNVFIILSNI